MANGDVYCVNICEIFCIKLTKNCHKFITVKMQNHLSLDKLGNMTKYCEKLLKMQTIVNKCKI